jgi:hypothetical protein
MNMNLSELINEILSEWAYRVDDGQPNPKNEKHLAELSIVLSEMGLSHIKEELFENITEADKNFKNAILNKEIPYKSADGTQKKGIVGNLLRLPKDSPGRVAAEKLMPPEGSEERDSAMKDLGSEKDGKSTGGDKEKGKEDEKPKDGEQPQGGGEEEKAKAAQAMFDPKADPAMGARMDREKAANDKLAQKDKENKEAEADAEKSTNSETPEGEYKPLETPPPQNEKGVVDADGKISGTEIDAESKLDDVPKSFLDKISTKMGQFYSHFKDDRLQAEKKAMEVFGYTQQDVNRLSKDKDSAEFKAYDDEVKKNQEPTFNLCSISIPGTNLFCDGNKGITRDKMPQFKGKPEEGSQAWNELEAGKKSGKYKDTDTEVEGEPFFRQLLADKDIKVTDATIASDSLKATQSELVGDKVMGMKSVLDKGPDHPAFKKITAPIFVSKDGYVVDGHHRWAAITAYNIDNPDNPLPMNVMIIDKDIDEAIDISNEFANNFGVAAKSGKQTGPQSGENPEPPKDEPSRPNAEPVTDKSAEGSIKAQTKTFKGESSGKEIKAVEFDGGAQIFGVQHRNTKMVDDIVNKVKSSIPEERWKDIVFLGEGGANDENGEMQFNDEQIHASEEFKKMGATIDSWDGDDLDVHNSESKLYKKQKEKTGLEDNQILAGNWASMVGQGEGEGLDPNDPDNRMKAEDYLDDNGKQFLQDAAKEAGLPPIENWDNPTGEKPSEENDWKGTGDRGTLYRLSFPKDNGDKETKINDIQVAFNETRDENLLEKTKELQAQGKIPISIAGEGHVDLVDDMIKSKNAQPKAEKPEEKLPEPKEPSKQNGGTVYSLGGGYYSDKPGGPAQYVTTENVVEKVLVEGDESWAYMLFEAVVTKRTAKGKTVKLKTIEPKNQKRATAAAKKEKEADVEETPDFSKMKPAQLKKYVEDRIAQAEADFDKSKNKSKFAIDFMLKRQAEINNNYLRPAGSPGSSLGELNGGKYINYVWKKGGNLTSEEETTIINEILETELAQQIPPKDRKRWAKIALETAKTEVKVLMYQSKYKAAKVQKEPYPMGVIMDKQSKAMLKKHFQELMKNAETSKQKKHYQKQLDYIDSLTESDTGVMYQREDGTVGFKHTSNKSAYNDPHNNTSVDEKIKAMRETLGGNLDPKLEKAFGVISAKVAAASAGIEDACRKFNENRDSLKPVQKNTQDAIIAKVVSAFPIRGGSKKNYLDDCKDKKWFADKAAELGIETPVKSEKDAVTVVIACAGDTPPPTAAIKVLTKVSELLERTTKDNVGKTAPLFNLTADELSSLAQSASGLRDAAKTRRDVMAEAHTELVGAIQKADKEEEPPCYPYDKNADNGTHQQAYVKDFLHRMHFTAYILGERDGVSSQNIGGDNVEPEYYRNCLAELSGYPTKDLDTPKGREGLVAHLEKRVRVSPKDDSIVFVNGKTKSELGREVYRTKGPSKSVVSGLGKEMQGCLKGKAKEAKK